MLFKDLGSVLRGRANWFQLTAATMLGTWLGFVPGLVLSADAGGGFAQSPGLVLTLIALVLVLNCNLGLFGLTFALGSLLSVPLLPVSFAVGEFLLDGPTRGLFEQLVGMPVIAWFGLEYYATTGGLAVATLVGALLAWCTWRLLLVFRHSMAKVESASAFYQRWSGFLPARLGAWLLFGRGKGKRTYAQLLEQKRFGLPVRPLGLLLVAALGVGAWLGNDFLGGKLVQKHMRSGLEQWNGATVDLAGVQLDLGAGVASVRGLAVANPEDLAHDTFRAGELTFALGVGDLLRRRLVIDEITSSDASSGLPREKPGVRLQEPPPPPPPPPGDGKTIDDYLKDVELWRERLRQVQQAIEWLAGGEPPVAETPEQREDRVALEAQLRGYASVVSQGLRRDAPMLWIRKVRLEGLRTSLLGDDLLDVRATNLSSNPALVGAATVLEVGSRSGDIRVGIQIDPTDGTAASKFHWAGLAVDDVTANLKQIPMRGGRMALDLDASLATRHADGIWFEAPLRVTLQDTQLELPGMKPQQVAQLVIPIGLRGPLLAPRISLDDKVLADALLQAGQQELARQVQQQIDKALQSDTGQKVQREIDKAKEKLDPALQKQLENLPKQLPGIGDIFGGKKKDG